VRSRIARRRSRVVALIVMLCTGLGVVDSGYAKKVYKWTDADGITHYGDKPPGDSAQTEIRLRNPPAVDPSVNTRAQRTERLLDSFAAEREEKKAARSAAAEKKKERQAKCDKARETRQTYRDSAFIYTKDDSGQRTILNDDEHAQVLADAQAAVDEWCD